MNFEFTEEDIKFRKEVREFMLKELPLDWPGIPWVGEPAKETEESLNFARDFTKKMRDRGWLTMHWPKKYGGVDAPLSKRVILAEEVGYFNAPQLDIYGPSIVGMTLIKFGTEEQKQQHLPKILDGNVFWTQGFSEPDAGSDLASIQTEAVESGDYFIVNGQKTWSSCAHYADWMFLLVRTDPDMSKKHRGISLLYVDMKTEGINYSPITNIAGGHSFNDVFFDNVKVPKENLIGEKNKGFYIAMASLNYERSEGGKFIGLMKRRIENMVEYIKERNLKMDHLPLIRYRLAKLEINLEALKLLAHRLYDNEIKGKTVTYEASIMFAFYADLMKRLSRICVQILGPYGQLGPESKYAPLYGMLQSAYLHTPAYSIAGGTTEIQRNLIAWHGLGLPKI